MVWGIQMAGKGRLIVSIIGEILTGAEREMLAHPMLAGVILFAKNYTNKQQVARLISDIKSIANLPIFVDQEGGKVQRFGLPDFTSLPAPKVFGEAYDLDREFGLKLAEKYGSIMAQELSDLTVIALGPVCDLDAGNSVITGLNRAFHANPEACYELLSAFISGMNKQGMNATGKHFPGHGQKVGDTHDNVVYDHRPMEIIEKNDLVPFIKLIKAGKLSAIMPAHIIYTKVDQNNTAGSSEIWLSKLRSYGFNGVIVSDCLSMKGAGDNSLLDKTRAALKFGDVAIICHQTPEDFIKLLNELGSEGCWLDELGQQRMSAWTNDSSNKLKIRPKM